MIELPDADATAAIVERVASAPTAPYHEWRALEAIRRELSRLALPIDEDAFAQVSTRLARGTGAKRSLVLVAHTDHPAFEVIWAEGRGGRARVRGGLQARLFARPVPVLVHDDAGGDPFRATLDEYTPDVELPNWSPAHARLTAERELRPGMWAVMDLPPFERQGDELRLRVADDLAGCALIIGTLERLREEQRAFDVRALFTRAEEPGLFGARLAAEAGAIPADAYVVSLEASRAMPMAEPGRGIVVRVGDYHNTFSNEAERSLRVAQERLAASGIPTQRALLTGGTCEASAFVRLGWTATGVALPNVNYHNAGAEDRFVPEIVRLSDVRSGVALLAEAAVAAAEDASESWWPDARVVPEAIRALLGPRSRP